MAVVVVVEVPVVAVAGPFTCAAFGLYFGGV